MDAESSPQGWVYGVFWRKYPRFKAFLIYAE